MSLNEQRKEIQTISERQIVLNLSTADCERLSIKAGRAGLTVSQLLENFIGDLVDGTYSNGSDERYIAQSWFERCGFSWNAERTLLKYFLDYGYDIADIESFLIACDECEHFNKNPSEYDEDNDYWCYREYEDFTFDFAKQHPDVHMPTEVQICRKWFEDMQKLKGDITSDEILTSWPFKDDESGASHE